MIWTNVALADWRRYESVGRVCVKEGLHNFAFLVAKWTATETIWSQVNAHYQEILSIPFDDFKWIWL